MLTYVTALFTYPEQKHRSPDAYFKYFEYIASTGVPIIVFLDPIFKDTENVKVIKDTYGNVRIEWMALDVSYVDSWKEPVKLPARRNEIKDTKAYMCIQLMKLKCLMMSVYLTDSEYIAWIDFGIFHVIKNIEKVQTLIKEYVSRTFPKDKIIAPRCNSAITKRDIINSICWYFAGGILIGYRTLFEYAYECQMKLVEYYRPHLMWEVNYWYLMRHLFISYDADHNDSILEIPESFITENVGFDLLSVINSDAFQKVVDHYNIDDTYFLERPGQEHYRLLSYLASFYKNHIFVDIVTDTGRTALALSSNESNKIYSFDVEKKEKFMKSLFPKNIEFIIEDVVSNPDNSGWKDIILNSALIVLDIHPHEGIVEYKLYEYLRDHQYKGIMICDDIWHFEKMRNNFWYKIPHHHKYDLTDVGHWSGTGIIFNFLNSCL